jgi:peptidylprolyl isomerase
MAVKPLLIPFLVLLAAGLSACGSSQAPGVQPAPSAGTTQASAATTAASTPSTTAPAASTPKPPSPLASKPVVAVPKGPPPKALVVKDLIKGTGAAAAAGSNVTVNYVGVLFNNGKEFDSSWKTGSPASFSLSSGPSGVISGWVKGIPGMRIGGRRELIIPPGMAYGKTGNPPVIPPNSTLAFVIDLLAVH